MGLLGSDGPCKESEVRKYAIERLKQADNDELEMFLLQLVQALKYENVQENESKLSLLTDSMRNVDMSEASSSISPMEQSWS